MNELIRYARPNVDNAIVHVPTLPSVSAPSVKKGVVHIPGYVTRRDTIKRKHAKDLGDLILGDPILGTRELQNTLEDNDSVFQNVPLLNRIAGFYHMSRERFLNPMFKGQFGKVLVNTLETMGGTADILANPVKSLMPWAGGGKKGDFLRSMGWLEGEYRETYQWDTGNFILDFLGEMVSDPINWITWGSGALSKSGVKSLIPEADNLIDTIRVTGLMDNKKVTLTLREAVEQLPEKQQRKILSALAETLQSNSTDDIVKKLNYIFVDQVVDFGEDAGTIILNDTAQRLYLDIKSYKQLTNKIIKANQSGLYDSYKKIVKAHTIAKGIDETLAKVAWGMTPIGYGVGTVKYIVQPALKGINHKIIRMLDDVTPIDYLDRTHATFEKIKRTAYIEAKPLLNFNEQETMWGVLQAQGLDIDKVNNLYLDTLVSSLSNAGNPRSYQSLKKQFKDVIQSRLNNALIVKTSDPIWKTAKLDSDHVVYGVRRLKGLLKGNGLKELKDIDVLIPESVYNKLFYDLWSTNKPVIDAELRFYKRHLEVLKDEMDKMFEKKYVPSNPHIKKIIKVLDDSAPNGIKEISLEKYTEEVLQSDVDYVRQTISNLKDYIDTITKYGSGYTGGYMDKQLFWYGTKENDPALAYSYLKEVLNGNVEDIKHTFDKADYNRYLQLCRINDDAIKAYQEYSAKILELDTYINKTIRPHLSKAGLLTHDIQNNNYVVEQLFDIFRANTKIEAIDAYPLKQVLAFIDKDFLKINDKSYDLAHLTEFFDECTRLGINPKHEIAILQYYGITETTGAYIQQLYKTNSTEAYNRLRIVLEQGKTGHRAYSSGLDSFRNINMRKQITDYTQYDALSKAVADEMTKNEERLGTTPFSKAITDNIKRLRSVNEHIQNLEMPNISPEDMKSFEEVLYKLNIDIKDFDAKWTSVFNIDYTKLTPEQFLEVAQNSSEILAMLDSIEHYYKRISKYTPPTVTQFIDELRGLMELIDGPVAEDVADNLDLSQLIYIEMLSREGKTRLLLEEEFANLDTKYGRWFNELKKPNSKARQKLIAIATELEDKGLEEAGQQLRELLLQVENHVVINRLLQMDVSVMPLNLDYSNTIKNYLNTVLPNKLAHDRFKRLSPVGIKQDANNLLNEILIEVEQYLRKNLKNPAEELLKEDLELFKIIYSKELEEYLGLLQSNMYNAGTSRNAIYDILDNRLENVIRNIHKGEFDVLKALAEFDEDTTQLRNDYDEVIKILYGTAQVDEKNMALFGLKNLDREQIENLNDLFNDEGYLDAVKRAYAYIGKENRLLAGVTSGKTSLATAQNLHTKAQVMQLINEAGVEANIAEWSMANRNLAFKKVYDPQFAAQMGISPYIDIPVTTKRKYLQFYESWTNAYERAKTLISYYKDEDLQKLKDRLIDVYRHAGTNGAPVNATTYFRSLDITDFDDKLKLITWDGVAQDERLMTNATRFKSTLETFSSPWTWYKLIDGAFESPDGFINVDALEDIINLSPPPNVLEDLYPKLDVDLAQVYKSSEKLKRTSIPYNRWNMDDIKYRKGSIDMLKHDKKMWEKRIISDGLAKQIGVPSGTNIASANIQEWAKTTIQLDEAETIARATSKQLRTIVDERGGFIIYVGEQGQDLFKFAEQELTDNGLMIEHIAQDEYHNIWFIRRLDNEIHNEHINWMRSMPSELSMLDYTKRKLLEYNKHFIDLEGTTIPWYYITGDTMDNTLYDYILSTPRFETFFGSKEVQETYLNYTFSDHTSFYTKSYSRPQLTIVGRDGYNRFIDYLDQGDLFRHKSRQLDLGLQTGMVDWITRHNRKTKWLTVLANDDTLLDNELFHNLLDNMSNADLKDMFRKGKYRAVVIKADFNNNPKVHNFIITNHNDLAMARKLGAHIFTEEMYRNAVFTINKHGIDNKLLMFYRRTIVGMFKSIWLTSPGFLMRNAIDSMLYKNMNETGGAVGMLEMFQYEYQAAKLLDMANQVQAEVFARTDGKTFNRTILAEVLNQLTEEERQLYYLTDTFLNSGASGSLTESMQEFLLSFNKQGGTSEYVWERTLNDMLFNSNISPIKAIMDVNGKIEQSARFGLFLALLDNECISVDEALARIIKTHFDYTVKNSTEDLLEQLFWFVTFPLNNLMYFVNGGLERNPIMLKAMLDLNELSWNNGEYTYDEVAEKPYLQYHVLQGNIRWRSKDGKKDYILKLGPSLFDFFNIMTDPVGQTLDRLNPFISVPLGLDEPQQLIPFYGQLDRAKKLFEGKSLIPSVYNTQKVRKFVKRRYPHYTYNKTYRNAWNFKRPKYYRKPRAFYTNKGIRYQHYWKSKYYMHETKWNNRFMRPISYEPYWSPTSNKYRGDFNMQRRRMLKLPVITPEMRPFVETNKKRVG